MALSDPRILFGVHSVTPYNRTTGIPYGLLRVLGNSSLALSGEQIDLFGGSARFAWETADGTISSEMTLAVKEYPDFLFELFLGKPVTSNSAEATGNVSAITNKNGTSVVSATVGIASVAATGADEADLKFGRYVVVATGADTVDVYIMSDVDFARGTDGVYLDDSLKIATGVTIPGTSGTVALADYGLTFTGGSGAIAFTTGDTATFEVRPINSGSTTVRIGSTSDVFPFFGAVVMAQQKADGRMFEVDAFKCKSLGMPINFQEKAFSEFEVTVKLVYDSAKNGVFDVREVEI